jgi:predicted PurR-regulated permease PerM
MADSPAPRPLLIDGALRLTLVGLLAYACFRITAPFLGILVWALLLAVMLWPLHLWLRRQPGLTNVRSATLIAIVAVAVLLVPVIGVALSLGGSARDFVAAWQSEKMTVPPMPAFLGTLPIVGDGIASTWQQAQTDLPDLLTRHHELLTSIAKRAGTFAAGLAATVLGMLGALAIAAIMVAWGDSGSRVMQEVFVRITNDETRGRKLIALSVATIRGVLQGIVGVAFVQAVIIGAGLFAMQVPFAGGLSVLVLLFGILQLPAMLITLPAIAWVLSRGTGTPEIVFAIYMLVGGLADNVLKPLMLGRGLAVPMPVILVGVIGGMLADGLLGLFVGPVLLAVGYVLFLEWLEAGPAA